MIKLRLALSDISTAPSRELKQQEQVMKYFVARSGLGFLALIVAAATLTSCGEIVQPRYTFTDEAIQGVRSPLYQLLRRSRLLAWRFRARYSR